MNKKDKSKSIVSINQEILQKANHIFEEFNNFTEGYRVLFLIQRHKEGGEINNSKLIKIISRNKVEYYDALVKLLTEQQEMHKKNLPARIYAAVNERDFSKAIRQFKYEQLEADYYDQVQKENFYLNIKNRFVGCLMQPTQKKTSYFLFDIDNHEDIKDTTAEILSIIPNEHIIKLYATKNGWHLITEPFNYTKLTLPKNCELKKDALLLLAY